MQNDTRLLLESVKNGTLSVEDALLKLKTEPFEELGYASIDLHRSVRKGANEVIYGAGKTAEQIIGILGAMKKNGQENVLITRLSPDKAEEINKTHFLTYDECSHLAYAGEKHEPNGKGTVAVISAGTSDLPVAREALITAQFLGNETVHICDAGVSGLHRLLSHAPEIMSARVIIAVAGMEGALPSVVAGLADCPVIAVPTSVGYGASFGGVAALLAMLNSCASGVSVVNIDNGFGAGYLADMINRV